MLRTQPACETVTGKRGVVMSTDVRVVIIDTAVIVVVVIGKAGYGVWP